MSDRTGRPVGDRTVRRVEQRNQEAQSRTLCRQAKGANSCRVPGRNQQTRMSTAARAEEVQQRDQQLFSSTIIAANFGIT